ncbi:hypothetical protein M9H77_07349 [Catharanthus roseus]|uniref:Uncharacterized protein n=1 Tax=Catharanthus roseus TaxID=4058 RepID=A0ACC0BUP3_CATRO|nr:hypothetical protein M9H77_07349 [Catharanthus roseus]
MNTDHLLPVYPLQQSTMFEVVTNATASFAPSTSTSTHEQLEIVQDPILISSDLTDTSSSHQATTIKSPILARPDPPFLSSVDPDNFVEVPLSASSTDKSDLPVSVPYHYHSMVTRSQVSIYKPNPKYALLDTSSNIPRIPKSIKSALRHDGWKCAAEKEMQALITIRLGA